MLTRSSFALRRLQYSIPNGVSMTFGISPSSATQFRWSGSCGKHACGCGSDSSKSATPCSMLSMEHRVIEHVLNGIENQCTVLEGAVEDDKEDIINFYTRALTFMKEFTDEHHHYKEENILFPHLGVSFSGPLNVMMLEHDAGREHVQKMSECISDIEKEEDPNELDSLYERLRDHSIDYTGLMRAHLRKEDQVLFPHAEKYLDRETKEKISALFAEREKDEKKAALLRGHVEWASNFE